MLDGFGQADIGVGLGTITSGHTATGCIRQDQAWCGFHLTGTLLLEVGSLLQVTGLDQDLPPWHRAQIIGALMRALCETRLAVHTQLRCVPCML